MGASDLLVPAFLVSIATVRLLAEAAPRIGLVALPSARSCHEGAVPQVGGAGLLLALLVCLAAGTGAEPGWAARARYLLPAWAFFLVGLADDRRGLGPGAKFALQVACAGFAVALGLRWEGRGLGPFGELTFGGLTPWLTVLWLVAVVNLVNLVDGIDLITCATVGVVLGAAAGGAAGPDAGLLYAVAGAAVLGLAFWNVAPARVFPGDGGTHLLGFLVGSAACGLTGAGLEARALPWAVASAPLLPGVLDVAGGILGKRRAGIAWWAPHREHLYQRLTRAGWSHAAVAARYGALALAGVALVAVVAPRVGAIPALGVGAAVLALHLGQGRALVRRRANPTG